MPPTTPPLSEVLPLLVLGSATFNSQYNPDPYALPTTQIVHRALSHGIRAFDTSPYYGPAETLLGAALSIPNLATTHPRSSYLLLTKVGRVSAAEFDYSPAAVEASVRRSCQRLATTYLDVVYCHDVEFVTPEEVIDAVRALRRLRDGDERLLRYVGISGYPVPVLVELARRVLQETGEPLDAVMSYANFTLQNTRLLTSTAAGEKEKEEGALAALVDEQARVDCVLNASVLGMGVLRKVGIPLGAMGDWHPSPQGLRAAVGKASDYIDSLEKEGEQGDRIEKVAIRWALERWLRDGAPAGSTGDVSATGVVLKPDSAQHHQRPKLGVSVMGVSTVEELDETVAVWRSVLAGLDDSLVEVVDDNNEKDGDGAAAGGISKQERQRSLLRQKQVRERGQAVRDILGPDWVDFTWPSPGLDFKRSGT